VTQSPQPTPSAAAPPAPVASTSAPAPPASPAPASAVAMADPLVLFRWLDVVLVVLAAPFVILAGLPVLGYVVGAAAWILNRVAGALVERLARARANVRTAVGLNLAALIARSWLVGLTILAVGLAGEREDGLMAAILLLAAFTLYFVTSLLLRPHERNTQTP
jgi:hypothetical protein